MLLLINSVTVSDTKKGFYDRYLQNYPDLITLALAYECQMVDNIEADPYDIYPQYIFTERHIYTKRSET